MLRNRLFPELTRFPKGRDRWSAWQRAQAEVHGHVWFILCAAAALGLYGWVVFSLPSLGVPMAWRGLVRGGLMFVLVVAALIGTWAFRKKIRRSLRRQLVERGTPICIGCGYDLSHTTGGRCPECGGETPGATGPPSTAG
ncbi:MAG: hypothetical protein ACYSU7_13975 [Planctomycetota bacterium]|jgi:uncharacterized membrane protein YedE/YeeE